MSVLKQKISRLTKNILILFKADAFIAKLAYNTHWILFKKLIPDNTYYKIDDIKTIVRHAVHFKVQPADFSQWFLFANLLDKHVDAALKVLNPNTRGIILDIGANCGHFSLIMAQKIVQNKWAKHVVAFEPNPNIFSKLNQNLNLNPQIKDHVQLINKGVGEEASVLELQIPIRNSGAGSLVRNYEHEPHEKHRIEVVSIDEYFAEKDIAVEFMKIDVESFEYYVLAGAAKTIEKYKPAVYIEMGEGQIRQKDIFSFFKAHDYSLYREEQGRFVLMDANNWEPINELLNLLAINKKMDSVASI